MKKLILFTGGVETLEFFTKQMGKTLENMGFSLFYFNLLEAEKSTRYLKRFIKPHETAVLTFNFEGLEEEDGLYTSQGESLWQQYRIPCYNMVVDHPMYYHKYLMQVPELYFQISIDKTHEAYLKKYYPQIKSAGFLPLAGTEWKENGHISHRPFRERVFDIVFTGNYVPLSECETYIHGINEEYAQFYYGILKELLEHPGQTMEDVMERHCEREMGKNSIEDLRFVYSRSVFLDLYVRNYERGAVIQALADGGIPVHVFGKDWDKLELKRPENLIMHPNTNSQTCLEVAGNAKISLNVMPWFKDGAHDRIFNAMLNGAVSLTDKSIFLEEEFQDKKELLFYDLLELDSLPGKIAARLADCDSLEEIANCGYLAARERHTWIKRAENIGQMIQKQAETLSPLQ